MTSPAAESKSADLESTETLGGELQHVSSGFIDDYSSHYGRNVTNPKSQRNRGGDIENGPPEEEKSNKTPADPNLVTWYSQEDKRNPRNWDTRKKWAVTIVMSSYAFLSPMSSSVVAPSLLQIQRDFGVTNDVERQMMLSVFILAYAVGPLSLGPLSEMYGRVPVLQSAGIFFTIFNGACGLAQNTGQLIAFRFLAGIGGSAPLSLGGGILTDLWSPEERGRTVSIYSLMPLLAPAIGPIIGGFIDVYSNWRWSFYAMFFAGVVIQVLGFIFLRETYAPRILHDKAKKLRKESGNNALHTEFEHLDEPLWKLLSQSLSRPLVMLGTQIIVQVLAVYMAYVYGLLYLIISTFPVLWVEMYGESVDIGGLNYIALAIGFAIGTQLCARYNNKIYMRLKDQSPDKQGQPEFRLFFLFVGAVLIPIGLFGYAWTAQYRVLWVAPDIFMALFAAGSIMSFQCIQGYLIDTYSQYSASAIAAVSVARSLAGFSFALFAPYMYAALGYGWGGSLLGFIAVACGLLGPFSMWKFGPKLRARSSMANKAGT